MAIIDLDQFRKERRRAATMARLRSEAGIAGRDYVAAVQRGAGILRRSGWREGDPTAPAILGTAALNDLRQAAQTMLAAEAALSGWPAPISDASA